MPADARKLKEDIPEESTDSSKPVLERVTTCQAFSVDDVVADRVAQLAGGDELDFHVTVSCRATNGSGRCPALG
jgi:hypothetical protein